MHAPKFADSAGRFADISRKIIQQALSQPFQVEVKADATPVTPIDRAVEQALRSAIEQEFPDHGIFGEEYDSVRLDSDYVWVLDPIDGTKAFMAGLPVFGTLIALTHRGKPILGVLDSPVTQQRWIGVDGAGTRLNGKEISVRACSELTQALACTSSPDYYHDKYWDAYQRMKSQTRWMIYGGGCHTFGQLANGFVDIAFETEHDVFDYMALVPIVKNAGGVISDWNGHPLTLNSGPSFVASGDPRVHDQALATLTL